MPFASSFPSSHGLRGYYEPHPHQGEYVVRCRASNAYGRIVSRLIRVKPGKESNKEWRGSRKGEEKKGKSCARKKFLHMSGEFWRNSNRKSIKCSSNFLRSASFSLFSPSAFMCASDETEKFIPPFACPRSRESCFLQFKRGYWKIQNLPLFSLPKSFFLLLAWIHSEARTKLFNPLFPSFFFFPSSSSVIALGHVHSGWWVVSEQVMRKFQRCS